jgi:hypothetical protein
VVGDGIVQHFFSDGGLALQEYHDNIGDLDGPEEKERAQARAKEIIAVL